MTRTRMTRPRSHTFYLPLAPSDAPLSLKAKLSVLPPQAANALLAPRARSSTAPSIPSSNSDSPNLSSHDNPCSALEAEDECARLERVLGCTTRAKDGTSRYRAASPELRNDWSTPSPPRSPSPVKPKEIIHVDMELDHPPLVLAALPTPPPTPSPAQRSSTDHYQQSVIPEPSLAGDESDPDMVFELDSDEVSSCCPSSLSASPRTEVTSHRRWSPGLLLTPNCPPPVHRRSPSLRRLISTCWRLLHHLRLWPRLWRKIQGSWRTSYNHSRMES